MNSTCQLKSSDLNGVCLSVFLYPKFIVGKDIAMLRVDVVSARICNINDEVTKWNVGDSSMS